MCIGASLRLYLLLHEQLRHVDLFAPELPELWREGGGRGGIRVRGIYCICCCCCCSGSPTLLAILRRGAGGLSEQLSFQPEQHLGLLEGKHRSPLRSTLVPDHRKRLPVADAGACVGRPKQLEGVVQLVFRGPLRCDSLVLSLKRTLLSFEVSPSFSSV